MIEKKTARVVHIDFGECFESSREREKYPELVPFRFIIIFIIFIKID
jgi:FKBP12-rapamycin complex-associated protein